LISRDTRYQAHAPELSELALELKRLAVEGSGPEQILAELAAATDDVGLDPELNDEHGQP
jgi:hypothetical protein